jgi:hypothetical protein
LAQTKHAFGGFAAKRREGLPLAHVHVELLGRGIDMVEVKVDHGSVVAADRACTTRLRDKHGGGLRGHDMANKCSPPDGSWLNLSLASVAELVNALAF